MPPGRKARRRRKQVRVETIVEEAGGPDSAEVKAAHMDQMLWERHLASAEAAKAAAMELPPQHLAALLAAYERQSESWASMGDLWAEQGRTWRDMVNLLMARITEMTAPATGP